MRRGAKAGASGAALFIAVSALLVSPALARQLDEPEVEASSNPLQTVVPTPHDEVPPEIVDAYRFASETAPCSIPWTLLAGVADFASDHGRGEGTSIITAEGASFPTLLGPPLDGLEGRELVEDTDLGILDNDLEFDHAVGTFQFIPQTWLAWASDGNGDGVADPNNVWDAALAATKLMCANDVETKPEKALSAYFGTDIYNSDVLRKAASVAAEVSLEVGFGHVDHLWAAEATSNSEAVAFVQLDGESEAVTSAETETEAPGTEVADEQTEIGASLGVTIDESTLEIADVETLLNESSDLSVLGSRQQPSMGLVGGQAVAPIVTPTPLNTRVHRTALVFGNFSEGSGPQPAAFIPWERGGSSFLLAEPSANPFEPVTLGAALETKRLETSGSIPVVGDWDGDGVDDVGVVDVSAPGLASFGLLVEGLLQSIVVEVPQSALGEVAVGESMADEWVVGDWNGDGKDTPGLIHATGGEVVLFQFDGFGRSFGRQVRTSISAEQKLLIGDWDGDGVDTVGVLADGGLTALDRLGDVIEGRSVSAYGETATLVVGTAPRVIGSRPAALSLNADAAYFGPVIADDGTELQLWRVRGILVEETIADSLLALLFDAEQDGIDLSGWGWRSHEAQIRLREANCADVWTAAASSCSPPTAIPGTSRHEYGVAVDFTSNGSILTWGSEEFEWLVENADNYGFKNLPSEAWHWSVDGG